MDFLREVFTFLTDDGLVGRLTMSQQERWPKGGYTTSELEHSLLNVYGGWLF